jgi:Phosphopantetheine attachment site
MTNLAATHAHVARSEIEGHVLDLLEEITQDWDIERPTPGTELGSLGLESINLVYLIAELQEEYALGDGLIARLRRDEADVRKLRVEEMAELVANLAREASQQGGAS